MTGAEAGKQAENQEESMREAVSGDPSEKKPKQDGEKLRLMFVGKIAAGKTSLCQRLNHEELTYRKTQTVQVLANDINMIDTPGEYLERRMFRGPLMVTAMNADLILLVQSALDEQTMFPPQFTTMFPKPCIGIVTKIDKAENRKIEIAEKYLEYAGVETSFRVSNVTEEGIPELYRYLEAFEEKLQTAAGEASEKKVGNEAESTQEI